MHGFLTRKFCKQRSLHNRRIINPYELMKSLIAFSYSITYWDVRKILLYYLRLYERIWLKRNLLVEIRKLGWDRNYRAKLFVISIRWIVIDDRCSRVNATSYRRCFGEFHSRHFHFDLSDKLRPQRRQETTGGWFTGVARRRSISRERKKNRSTN